jgi:RNA polymerase sigma-70 factor, ECF subfamily
MNRSPSEADDAVQETWLRLHRADLSGVGNLGGWLTTVVGRICLDQLRARKAHPADSLDFGVPDDAGQSDPEAEAVRVDAVGQALQVVLDRLAPAERLAFVLYDLFDVPFERVAETLDRSPAAARQLASRARRRVRGHVPDGDHRAGQHAAVSAFLAAAREGDFDALLKLLAPDIVVRAGTVTVTGRDAVAEQAVAFARHAEYAEIRTIDGLAGIVVVVDGRVVTTLTFVVAGDQIRAIEVLGAVNRHADPGASSHRGSSRP